MRLNTVGREARVFRRHAFVSVVLLALSAVTAGAERIPTPAQLTPAQSGESIVAIGDVHGDFDDFAAILEHTGLIDNKHRWTGGQATLVQVGDLLDRGPKEREVMDLLISSQKQAAQAGGRVVVLLGNHEVMNLMGDLRYATAVNFGSFSDSKSEQRRRSAYQEYLKWRKSHADLIKGSPDALREQSESEWMSQHPPGFIEHREAFGPNGSYGKWLRGRPAVAKIGSLIFLHGGIHPSLVSLTLDQINARVHDEINAFDNVHRYLLDQKLILPFFTLDEITAVARAELDFQRKLPEQLATANRQREVKLLEEFLAYGSWLSVNLDGPLWFRGYDRWGEQDGAAEVDKLLRAFGAAHIVVGHTPQRDGRIRSRFGGKVFLIDTGMLASFYPGGRASALRILDDAKFTATYMDQREVCSIEQQRGRRDWPIALPLDLRPVTDIPNRNESRPSFSASEGPQYAYWPKGPNNKTATGR